MRFSHCLPTTFRALAIGLGAVLYLPATDAPAWAEDAPRHTLAYRFQAGQFVHYTLNSHVEVHVQSGEVKQKTVNDSDTAKHFRVVSIEESGNYVIEPEIDHVRMSSQFDDESPIRFDSSDTSEPAPQFAPVRQSIGQPLVRLKVTPQGKLVAIQALAAHLPQVERAVQERDPQINVLALLPEQPVAIGDTWKEQFEVSVFTDQTRTLTQKVTLRRLYQLDSVTDGIAKITMKTAVLSVINDPFIEGQLVQSTPSGTLTFDIARGVLLSRDTTLEKSVVGAIGPNTLINANSQTHEKLAEPPGVLPVSGVAP